MEILTKNECRNYIKSKIRQFTELNGCELPGKFAADFLCSHPWYKNASLLLCFLSCGKEISTSRIISKALADGKTVLVPKVIPDTNFMDFYRLKNLPLEQQTVTGSFGISEPDSRLEKISPETFPAGTLVILPGLAFSKKGRRLGKGKGFYDRFLSEAFKVNSAFKETSRLVGLCYDIQIMDNVPGTTEDVDVDALVTEKGIYNCKTKL